MFTWILIALAIAFIFGVIKVETIKDATKKYEPQIRELFNKTKAAIEAKAAEVKKNNAQQTQTSKSEEVNNETTKAEDKEAQE